MTAPIASLAMTSTSLLAIGVASRLRMTMFIRSKTVAIANRAARITRLIASRAGSIAYRLAMIVIATLAMERIAGAVIALRFTTIIPRYVERSAHCQRIALNVTLWARS